jgi:hypothetical protein
LLPVQLGHGCDACSCMFALHYLLNSPSRARATFTNAWRATRPGVAFFGICVDWRYVQRDHGSSAFIEASLVDPVNINSGNAFEQKYTFRLPGDAAGIPETLVHMPTIEEIGEQCGWRLELFQNAAAYGAGHGMEQLADLMHPGLKDYQNQDALSLLSHYAVFVFRRNTVPHVVR